MRRRVAVEARASRRHSGLRLQRGAHPGELPPFRCGVRYGPAPRLLRREGELEPHHAREPRPSRSRGRRRVRRRAARGLECGFPADRVVFSGVGKTERRDRARRSTLAFSRSTPSRNGRSRRSSGPARDRGRVARVALRVNPDIDARSHPYISTGLRQNKFGVDIDAGRRHLRPARRFSDVRMTGMQAHIGSQILDPAPLAEAAKDSGRRRPGASSGGVSHRDRWTSAAASAWQAPARPR